MPKSQNQKLKLLYIIKILEEQTDEQHYMSTKELIEALANMILRLNVNLFIMIWNN